MDSEPLRGFLGTRQLFSHLGVNMKNFLFQNPQTSDCPLLTTEALAFAIGLRPQSIRKRLSQTGAYFGLRPVKLPNGRLLWPADAVARLAFGASK